MRDSRFPRALGGKIATPIRRLIDDDEHGRIIFKVKDFQQKFNTRTAALGSRTRWNLDIYTHSDKQDELHVIKNGCEDLPAIVVDLRGEKE